MNKLVILLLAWVITGFFGCNVTMLAHYGEYNPDLSDYKNKNISGKTITSLDISYNNFVDDWFHRDDFGGNKVSFEAITSSALSKLNDNERSYIKDYQKKYFIHNAALVDLINKIRCDEDGKIDEDKVIIFSDLKTEMEKLTKERIEKLIDKNREYVNVSILFLCVFFIVSFFIYKNTKGSINERIEQLFISIKSLFNELNEMGRVEKSKEELRKEANEKHDDEIERLNRAIQRKTKIVELLHIDNAIKKTTQKKADKKTELEKELKEKAKLAAIQAFGRFKTKQEIDKEFNRLKEEFKDDHDTIEDLEDMRKDAYDRFGG